MPRSISRGKRNTCGCVGSQNSLLRVKKDKKLLFTPRHDFFSLDAGALKENCFCPILGLAYSEIRPLCARLALVSGKRPALVQSSSRLTCAPVPSLSFIVNLGNGALSLGGLSVLNGSGSARQCSGGGLNPCTRFRSPASGRSCRRANYDVPFALEEALWKAPCAAYRSKDPHGVKSFQ